MPSPRRRVRRKQRELTDPEFWELLLGPKGPKGPGLGCTYGDQPDSAFKSEAARAAAWADHGADLKAGQPGRINPLFGEVKYEGATAPEWSGKPLNG